MAQALNRLMTATVLAASAACSGVAGAASGAPITAGAGSMRFDFSEMLVGALNTANNMPSGLGQSLFTEDPETGAMSLEAAVSVGTVFHDDASGTLSPLSARSGLGTRIARSALLPSGKRGGSPDPGGWVTIGNIELDFDAHAVYADVAGHHGYGERTRLHLWTFGALSSSVTAGQQPDTLLVRTEVSQLSITEAGFELFRQGLALSNTLGVPSLRSVNDYGTIRATLQVDARLVPEPASHALMGIGLVGMGLLSRVRSRGTSAEASLKAPGPR